ncbi:hypothetical protein LCGC14_0983620 [marine sediment metagenome]|uniref:Uncharacterized protein n=1 Tax=marine sediment metagenome TaxID=412755 RepID=A0A0F9N7U7_9ZZZZ
MADRFLTWHQAKVLGSETRIGPVFYMDADYEPVAVRIYAVGAPRLGDTLVDIFDDGVSIFADRGTAAGDTRTVAALANGENFEEIAEDFSVEDIAKGSLVHCEIVDAGDCRDLSVHLELQRVGEPDEETE